MLLSFAEVSAIVSEAPRLLPMACAISYSAEISRSARARSWKTVVRAPAAGVGGASTSPTAGAAPAIGCVRTVTDDGGAAGVMNYAFMECCVGGGAGVGQEVVGDGELADGVQQGRPLRARDFVVGHAEGAREGGGIPVHAAGVALRCLIFCVN